MKDDRFMLSPRLVLVSGLSRVKVPVDGGMTPLCAALFHLKIDEGIDSRDASAFALRSFSRYVLMRTPGVMGLSVVGSIVLVEIAV